MFFELHLTLATHIFPCRRCPLVRWWVGLNPASPLACSWRYKLVTVYTCCDFVLWVMNNLISLFTFQKAGQRVIQYGGYVLANMHLCICMLGVLYSGFPHNVCIANFRNYTFCINYFILSLTVYRPCNTSTTWAEDESFKSDSHQLQSPMATPWCKQGSTKAGG